MKEYLETTSPHNINYDSWFKFSGLDFLQASSEWNKNFNEIVEIKKDKRSEHGKYYINPFKK